MSDRAVCVTCGYAPRVEVLSTTGQCATCSPCQAPLEKGHLTEWVTSAEIYTVIYPNEVLVEDSSAVKGYVSEKEARAFVRHCRDESAGIRLPTLEEVMASGSREEEWVSGGIWDDVQRHMMRDPSAHAVARLRVYCPAGELDAYNELRNRRTPASVEKETTSTEYFPTQLVDDRQLSQAIPGSRTPSGQVSNVTYKELKAYIDCCLQVAPGIRLPTKKEGEDHHRDQTLWVDGSWWAHVQNSADAQKGPFRVSCPPDELDAYLKYTSAETTTEDHMYSSAITRNQASTVLGWPGTLMRPHVGPQLLSIPSVLTFLIKCRTLGVSARLPSADEAKALWPEEELWTQKEPWMVAETCGDLTPRDGRAGMRVYHPADQHDAFQALIAPNAETTEDPEVIANQKYLPTDWVTHEETGGTWATLTGPKSPANVSFAKAQEHIERCRLVAPSLRLPTTMEARHLNPENCPKQWLAGDYIAVTDDLAPFRLYCHEDELDAYIEMRIPRILDKPEESGTLEIDTEENKPMTNATQPAIVALREGAKLAGCLIATERLNAATCAILTRALEQAGTPPSVMETPAVATLLRLVAPLALAQVGPSLPGVGQHAGSITRGCTLAFAAELQKLMIPIMQGIGPLVTELTEAAQAIDVTESSESAPDAAPKDL